jgi:3-dehydrotetronate 4-kinase
MRWLGSRPMAEKLLLGCIADDFTGATDLAGTLVRNGMRTTQVIGPPKAGESFAGADAIVVALKSRTAPKAEAVAQSLTACRWLKGNGARQFYFKYCSTFDSTAEGNIGPVADALLAELGADFTIVCPAFPETKRTIYQGHLFVDAQLLSDSAMRHHPLTPMTDSNLLRLMAAQTRAPVGLLPWSVVHQGSAAILAAFDGLRRDGITYAVVDVIEDADLLALGEACADLVLLTGGSGAALGLPANFRRKGLLASRSDVEDLPEAGGAAAVLAGSCAAATLRQVEHMKVRHPAFKLEPIALSENSREEIARALGWAVSRLPQSPVLIYASAPPDEVGRIQARLGRERAGALVEQAMAHIAQELVSEGVRRLVIAGGETSGAVVAALRIPALRVGRQIDPGIPMTLSTSTPHLALALKSGNFGTDDFFSKALSALK